MKQKLQNKSFYKHKFTIFKPIGVIQTTTCTMAKHHKRMHAKVKRVKGKESPEASSIPRVLYDQNSLNCSRILE